MKSPERKTGIGGGL